MGAGGQTTAAVPAVAVAVAVTLNARRRKAQRDPCLFEYANSAAREMDVHMFKCARMHCFLIRSDGKANGDAMGGWAGSWVGGGGMQISAVGNAATA